MEPAEEEQNAENQGSEFHDSIKSAFDLFDNEGNKTIEQREIATIMRWLGCVPSEADVAEAIAELQDKEYPGLVTFDKFLPFMTKILVENKFQPASNEELLRAFKVLDVDNKSFLTQEQLTKLMTEEGEPLSNEELEEMFGTAVNTEDNCIAYKDYLSLLMA